MWTQNQCKSMGAGLQPFQHMFFSILCENESHTGFKWQEVMWYLFTAIFIFTAYETHACVMTSPDQRVDVGTDVCLLCNFTQCPGQLDPSSLNVEWEFKQGISFQPKIILYQIGNRTASTPGHHVLLQGNVKLGSFDIVLHSVTHENNGTYMCRLRRDGIFYKNNTQLIVHSAPLTRRNTPGVDNVETHPPWWVAVVSVAGIVLLIGTVFLGRRTCRSPHQRKDILRQNIAEVETRGQTADIRYKVTNHSMPVVDMGTQPSTPNADNVYAMVTNSYLPIVDMDNQASALNAENIYVTMVTNNSLPVGKMASKSSTQNADNIYVTMHGSPFTTNAAGKPNRNRRLTSDWKPDDEEPVSAHCHQFI
ncbi:uncharacterized protein LOC130564548 isoform X3 [Triplophysa rosa]|uniref:uncharacterized protein LOC130564548 isoform X3 n=1 Tax=Triplophysa rosa TaxID=992332 RepID=UPI00254601EA|nr:uncharacterized protein LOC130564548 isoform X3 [Triplophysa rosa]